MGAAITADFRFVKQPVIWQTAAEMIETIQKDRGSVIDVPIGLTSDGSGVRKCEPEARKRLGKKGSSIFSPPMREALYAESYLEAKSINFKFCGKKISKQSWNIIPQIKDVDRILSRNPALQTNLRESHPELCFCMLNSRAPIFENKKTTRGRALRLAILEKLTANARAYFTKNKDLFLRKDAGEDDIVDAMILAYVAAFGAQNGFSSIPEKPEYDSCGLRMEMVFAE